MNRWHQLTKTVKTELGVYRRVLKHPRTPGSSRWLFGLALFYLLSPVDLIPDWLPVIGQLDDLLIVPFLIWLALKCTPADVIRECRETENGSIRKS